MAELSRNLQSDIVVAGGDHLPAPSLLLNEGPVAVATSPDRARESLNLLEADLAALIVKVGEAAGRVHTGIGKSTDALEAIAMSTSSLTELVDTAGTNMNLFASATEQIAQSSAHISSQIHSANQIAGEASVAASATEKQVQRLHVSSAEIGKVVTLISTIAKQTHLLALNASIEAARAGDAGRGFAVVANEVKALSAETQQAIAEISKKVEALQKDAGETTQMLARIARVIDDVRPLFAAISSSVEQQVATTAELSTNAAENSRFIRTVAENAKQINESASEATQESGHIDRSAQAASDLSFALRKRLSIFLRQTEIGDRRLSDRLPCDWKVTVTAAGMKVSALTVDIGEGGLLLRKSDTLTLRTGEHIALEIADVGALPARVVNSTDLGIHCCFFELSPESRAALSAKLDSIRAENREFIERAIETAVKVSDLFERLISSKKINAAALFDNRYDPIEGTDPQQVRTAYLDVLDAELPAIQEPLLASDPRMVFCAAVDRNGYLPVHNLKYSHPQRQGEVEWNGMSRTAATAASSTTAPASAPRATRGPTSSRPIPVTWGTASSS